MNSPNDEILVSSSTPLGECIIYENAPSSRLDYIKRWTPQGIKPRDLARAFKRDIAIESFLERIRNVNVFYVESMNGRGDELYYFACNNRFFHGEKIWSRYHPFFSILQSITPSAEVVESSWFVGSRNNYTHQLIDFLPNLIYRAKQGINLDPSAPNVFGKTNNILESVCEVPYFNKELNSPRLFLKDLGEPVAFGPWQVRCIKFRELFLVRHLSIFKAFSLVQGALNLTIPDKDARYPKIRPSTLYLSRGDTRVLNQENIEAYLCRRYEATIIKDIFELSFADKARELSLHDRIVVPPGSDIINALCFSRPSSILVQMIPVLTKNLLESPFTSYACLRYLLPFLHRIFFLPSLQSDEKTDINSGAWDLMALENLLSHEIRFNHMAMPTDSH